MTDRELKLHVYAFLCGAMLLGLFLFFWPSIQYVMFMYDCAPAMGEAYCRGLWELGNGP